MAKKKSTSVFLEPYNLFLLLGQSIALLSSSIVQGFKDARLESQQPELSDNLKKEAYAKISEEFDTPEFQKNWRTFLLRGLCVQGFLLVLTLTHLLFGNIGLGLQLLIVFIGSVVFFGYKPWIRRNKQMVSFMTYFRSGLRQDPQALLLWTSLKGQ